MSKEYLSFTKKERSGIIMLVLIVFIVAVVPKYLFPEKKLVAKIEGRQQQQQTIYQPADVSREQKHSENPNPPPKSFYPRTGTRQRPVPVIEINSADTAAFIALPGIGSKLASRIVMFREKLGGFYSVSQIGEVYGLQDSVFRKIRPVLRCDHSEIKKININSAEKEKLKAHPYIRWNLANILVQYRAMHGPFTSIKDLENIENLDSAAVGKMAPYLRFE